MPMDPSAVGATAGPFEQSWNSKDALLYAVALGAGTNDVAYTTENTKGLEQRVLPTFPVLLGGGAGGAMAKAGTFNFAMLVHASQSVVLHKPIPVEGTVRTSGTLVGVYDKGSGAVLETEIEGVDAATGEPLFTCGSAVFIRGEGGFGGERGPSVDTSVPERAPDHEVVFQTSPDQALLYRLCGDRNPLHSDPAFAALGGFDRPILHGLCTYGFTGRALLRELCDNDDARFKSISARFSSPVLPGEALTVQMWRTGDGAATFHTKAGDRVVINAGRCTFA